MNVKKLFACVSIVSFLSLGVFYCFDSPVAAVVDSAQQACAGLSSVGVECSATSGTAEEVAAGPVNKIVTIMTWAVGVVCAAMIVFGGFKFVTSGGDAEKAKNARSTIIYAVVGLVLVLLSSFIVRFAFRFAQDITG